MGETSGTVAAGRARSGAGRGDRGRHRRLRVASVEPRFGRLYASAVLRPLAEQVVGVLGVQPGETACDLICDSAVGGVALARAVGNQGRVVLVDTEATLLDDAARDVSDTGCVASTLLAAGGAIPLGDASCDRVVSLCTFAFWDGESLLDAARRAT